MCALQMICMSHYHSTRHAGIPCTERPEPLQVLVYGTGTDVASTGKLNLCRTVFTEQCSHQIVGCSDFLDIIPVNNGRMSASTIDLHRMTVDSLYYYTNALHRLDHNIDVPNIGQIVY